MGTDNQDDDKLADWSSRGRTQDGFDKPEVVAPGAHIISTARAEQRVQDAVPDLHRVERVHDARRHVDGGADGRRRGRALMLEEHPGLTPDQVKGMLMSTTRNIRGRRRRDRDRRRLRGRRARRQNVANAGSTPNKIVNPATGDDRLLELALEPVALERGLRRQARRGVGEVALELRLLRLHQRQHRADALALEPVALVLEPLPVGPSTTSHTPSARMAGPRAQASPQRRSTHRSTSP